MLNLSKNSISKVIPEEKLYSLRALKTPRAGKLLARLLMGIGLLFILILFLPWQQNVRGTGKVTAFNPVNRPQTVETVIGGRVQKWFVIEGQYVQAGDTIVTLSEVKEKYFDPQLLQRLHEQIMAKTNSVKAKEDKTNALKRQITALREGLRTKLEQAQAKLEAEKIKFQNAENQFARNKKLYEAGNIPLTKFQDIEYKFQESQASYLNAKIELERVEAEYQDKISKAESDLNNTQSELFETQGEIAKLQNEYANMQIRNNQYQVLAPQSGVVVKTMKAGIGETLREGDAICTIMPDVQDVAVEMYVRAMDVPLISKGRHVRIQFDGWPALQFSGWPSVSVGTFGGLVQVIDFINSKPGEFRVLIVPDKADETWPKQLRVGSGIKGWVMLDDVPVWYEIWRQLNGFPPSLYEEPLQDVIDTSTPGKSEQQKEEAK
jgi:multidrug resistance efflux pump